MADVLLNEGLFHAPKIAGEKPYLIGSRCRICGYACFPKKEICIKCCQEGTMDETKIGSYGYLETFAVMHVGTPDFPPPYLMGYVRTGEGALVFTLITGCDPRDDGLQLGEKMELVIEKIKKDKDGNDRIGWKFRPIRGGEEL